ncbi:MAG: aldehyde dehydrogenase (NADP(+)) [Pseudomonadota bacterium]
MLTGNMLIGSNEIYGEAGRCNGFDPNTDERLQPEFGLASAEDVDLACALAWEAFDKFRASSLDARATFLERIAENILGLGDELIARTVLESGLPRARIETELGRTVGQLRLFAEVVREGSWLEARIDNALPERKPMPRADLRLRHVALGPVAVFGASNFPLAFSVAGGDTASALAAGCPVVVKAHPAHPGTSELVARAIQEAVKASGLHEGVFSLLFTDLPNAIRLVTHPYIKAVGFTGSRNGGLALMEAAAGRAEPIPVFAEMSSINPVFLLPSAAANRPDSIAKNFVAALTMGAGQFCTNPGLVLALDCPGTTQFLSEAGNALKASTGSTMLTKGIRTAFVGGVARMYRRDNVTLIARGQEGVSKNSYQSALFATTANDFINDVTLQEEIFGVFSLIVVCKSNDEMLRVAEHLEGQLTATIQMDDDDTEIARVLLPVLERKAGRILFNGYPTGVEVCHSMVHGGPYPATSDPRFTSVGTLAIRRFLRPVCYQDVPPGLLPDAIKVGNPLNIWRRVNGKFSKD